MQYFQLPSVRGPQVNCPEHPKACGLENVKKYAESLRKPLAVDLFSGAGGLSLGLQEAGFEVILGVDKNPHAATTHRANFGGASINADLSQPGVVKKIGSALNGVEITLVAGGPPCQPFSRAGRSKINSLIEKGVWSQDGRKELWRVFVDVVRCLEPKAVLLENVPEMGVGENSIILRRLVHELESLGYSVNSEILSVWHHGVPQHRQRLFLVGLLQGVQFNWPARDDSKPTIEDAISDMPPVKAGEGALELPYKGPRTPYQEFCRKRIKKKYKARIFDHVARPVRKDDLEAFKLMTTRTLYPDLPKRLRRYRSDIFEDKYKRLPWKGPSRTITAHLAKDGYWYIHPKQHRTLTVREAARIQSFPDRFRFNGARTNAFQQIGEAVPPLVGMALGRCIIKALQNPRSSLTPQQSTRNLARLLQTWMSEVPEKDLMAPWLKSREPWAIFLGILLFGRSKLPPPSWPRLRSTWRTPKAFLKDSNRKAALVEIGKADNLSLLNSLARTLSNGQPELKTGRKKYAGLSSRRIKGALAASGKTLERPFSIPAARIAARVFGQPATQSRIKGELLIARLVGPDEHGKGYAAVLELANRFCRLQNPLCRHCPLGEFCIMKDFHSSNGLRRVS